MRRKCPSLQATLDMLRAACTNHPDDIQTVRNFKVWKPLLTVLASFNSICPLIPNNQDLMPIATGLSVGMHLDGLIPAHKSFSKQCPVIANICMNNGGFWPDEARALLVEIIKVCKAPFNVANTNQEQAANVSNLEFWQEGHWYPHWPRVRKAKTYSNYYTAVPEPVNGV